MLLEKPAGFRSHVSERFTRYKIGPAFAAVFALLLTLAFASAPARAQLSGAIFTTLADGTAVNHNIYDSRQAVYLNGGPQNMNDAGLPVGIYYFQVTNPNGDVLLSTDLAIYRKLLVAYNANHKGVVSGAVAPGSPPYKQHTNGTYNPANGSTPVQLYPFDFTPNPGGEYKAWLIPEGKATVDSDGKHLLFSNSDAKTDNFKVREKKQFCIDGVKFYDLDIDGIRDGAERLLSNWAVNVAYTLPNGVSGVAVTYTDSSGEWALCFPAGTTFTASEVIPDQSWVQTAPIRGSTIGGTNIASNAGMQWVGTVPSTDTFGLDFGNYQQFTIHGKKYYDPNKNGKADTGDLTISGFKIVIDGTLPSGYPIHDVKFTDATGGYSATYPVETTYTVTEVQPTSDYYQSGPVDGAVTSDGNATADKGVWTGKVGTADTTGLDFFNYCLVEEPGYGGHTKGFWHNQNGEAILLQDDPGWRTLINGLNLVNPDNSSFTVSTTDPFTSNPDANSVGTGAFDLFSNWIVGQGAVGNANYILGTQLAAAALNLKEGALLVAAGQATQAQTGNEILVLSSSQSAIIAAGSGIAGPYTLSQIIGFAKAALAPGSGASDDYRLCLSSVLDGLNNNAVDFLIVSPTPCPFTTPY